MSEDAVMKADMSDGIFKDNCITQVAATICTLLGAEGAGPSFETGATGPLSGDTSAEKTKAADEAQGAGSLSEAEGAVKASASLRASAARPLASVLDASSSAFGGACCDRVFMYNPDAIACWIYQKYKAYFAPLETGCAAAGGSLSKDAGADKADAAFKAGGAPLMLEMRSVVPPKTPVCFASMYSGLTPEEHGIRKYEKPVLTVPTIFDALPAAGKKVAIVSTAGDSISLIFLNRPVDYFIYKTKQECNKKALELIREDTYDVIVLYNGDYDYWMHRVTPTGFMARRALRENISTYCTIRDAISTHWKQHRTALAFAPDHGCHAKFGIPPGDHGEESEHDMNIAHWWSFL